MLQLISRPTIADVLLNKLVVVALLVATSLSIARAVRADATVNVELVTISDSGDSTGNHVSGVWGLNALNGRFVLFGSRATNLTPDAKTMGGADLFVRDRETGTTELITKNAQGMAMGELGGTSFATLTPDGRFAVFTNSSPLIADDGNRADDVYVRDIAAHETILASVGRDGEPAGGFRGYISADGRFVVFSSNGSNIVANDADGLSDVFIRDLHAGTTRLVTPNTEVGSDIDCAAMAISRDARFVLVQTFNPDRTGYTGPIYLRDVQAGTATLISESVKNPGFAPAGRFENARVSDDGRFVVFDSTSRELVADDSNGAFRDVYLRDVLNGTTRRINSEVNDDAVLADISADGRIIAFIAGYSNNYAYIHDRETGSNQRIKSFLTRAMKLDRTGRYVLLQAGNQFSYSDTNNAQDLILYDRASDGDVLLSRNLNGSGPGDENSYVHFAYEPVITDDARTVVFASNSTNLVTTPKYQPGGNTVPHSDVYVATVANVSAPGALLNVSTRGHVGLGDDAMIGGFVIAGSGLKTVLIRALGPSLSAAGVSAPLMDPRLEIFDSSGAPVGSSDSWTEHRTQVEATGLPPKNPREAAIVHTFPAGAYTAVVRGKGGDTGIGLVEVYDLSDQTESRLANISTRGFVGAGDGVMIGGFIARGERTNVLARALGPSLSSAGVPNGLANPMLELRDGNGALIRENDDWQDGQESEISATGIPPKDGAESALIVALAPGPHTALVRDSAGSAGVALVELYHLD